MDFLSRTEQKLGAEISGNYQSLLEQQQDHEVIFLQHWSVFKINPVAPRDVLATSQPGECVFFLFFNKQ